jgi:long-chain acyl-CoA synthetase
MVTYDDKPWLSSYEPDVTKSYDVPDAPIHSLLENSARRFPDHNALIFKGNIISYRKLNDQADAVAAALAANGFKKGDRSVIYLVNSPQLIISYFGILKAGGIVIATNPLYSER